MNLKRRSQMIVASIMFTSGTTGPESSATNLYNHYASALGCKESLDLVNLQNGYRYCRFITFLV